MTIDVNSRRRMVVNKFSNRPPFDLKNREISVLKGTEKRKESFENVNKSYKSIIQQLDAAQFQDSRSDSNSNKTNNIIPKIIESFQKVTPSRQVVIFRNKENNLSSKDSSLQTLYRNNQHFGGKHIPKHKIMKNLLQDFENETSTEIKNSCYDTIPTKDPNCTCSNRADGYSSRYKVDKTTSTSGLGWPKVLQSGERIPVRTDKSQKSLVKSRSRIPKRKDARRKVKDKEVDEGVRHHGSKPSTGNSGVEYVPSKDMPDFSNEGRMENKQMNRHLCLRENTYVLEENWEGEKSGRIKEKSFVQDQVDKFNKLASVPAPRRKKGGRDEKWERMNSNMNQNYMGMMASVKKHFPQMKLRNDLTTTDNYDWSNPEEETTEVKFPKETKNAMETLIQNSRKCLRAPLSKYLNYQDGELQPAIPEYVIGFNRNRLPCTKNLMCDRGEHEGPCVNKQKVSPCRHKKRRSKGIAR